MMSRRLFLFTFLLLFFLLPQTAPATVLPHKAIKNGGYILFRNDRIIEQHHSGDLFIPASTIKLLTAYTALKTLGPEYRFTTSFYLDANQVLYIKGGGDPILTTESLAVAARELKNRGINRVSAYVIDDSAFRLEHPLPDGSENTANPYDVANSALAVNFNSIAIVKRADGTISSPEEQTPLTPLGVEIAQHLPAGKQRVNIDAFPLQHKLPLSLRYSAELMHALLTEEGVVSEPTIRQGKVSKQARLIYQHASAEPVLDIIRSCLYVSNNFMANQLALTAGAVQYGYPATWEKAQRVLTHYARERIGISPKDLKVVEGSGLSRQTRVTAAGMLKILRAFEPYRELLPQRFGAQLKSGTMANVYCYAGYIDSSEGAVLFVMLLNQPENTRKELMANLTKRFSPKISKQNSPQSTSR